MGLGTRCDLCVYAFVMAFVCVAAPYGDGYRTTVTVTVPGTGDGNGRHSILKIKMRTRSLSSALAMASVRCRCGSVGLKFTTKQPVHLWQCCCVDCYDKNLWSCQQTGTQPPPGLEKHGKGQPPDLAYFANRLEVMHGRNMLAFNKLRPGANSTNMIAACCSTLLCVDHPAYQQNLVLTFPNFVPLNVVGEMPKAQIRLYIKDWPADAYAKLPPMQGCWREQGERLFSPPCSELPASVRNFEAAVAIPPPSGPGETFQELLAATGGVVMTLGRSEGLHSWNRVHARTA